ncbi:MAG: TonB-dependent receptor [Steroidobacteraceae bacterium]
MLCELWFAAVLSLVLCFPAAAMNRMSFNVAQQSADKALIEFARQAELQMLFPTERINQFTTHALQGNYSIEEALTLLLRDTGLSAELSGAGMLIVKITQPVGSAMKKKNWLSEFFSSLAVSATVVAYVTPSVTHAQEIGEAQLEEIIVTATKRDTDLQRTSIAIQVYSAETLQKEGKKRIDEIMNGTVGVQVQDGPGGASFYMRGINGTPFFNDTGGTSPGLSTVAIMVDGVVQARGEVVRGGTLDMAQVEVMRGPQSTTVGANSLVGAVSLVSNQPAFDYHASGSLEVGNYNLQALQAVLNMPLSSNQALRFAFSTNKRDGYASSGAGDSDLTNVRAKYRWQASTNLNLVLTAERQVIGGLGVTQGATTYAGFWEPYSPARAACTTTVLVDCYDQISGYPAQFGHVNTTTTYLQRSDAWNDGYPADSWPNDPFFTTKINTYSANLDWQLGFGTLTFIPSRQRINYKTTGPEVVATGSFIHYDHDQTVDQFDLRLASNNGTRLEWLAGLYYSDNSRNGPVSGQYQPGAATGTNVCPAAGSTGNPQGLYCFSWTDTLDSESKSSSVYGNLSFSLLETLRLSGALRYTKDEKSFTSSQPASNSLALGVGASDAPRIPYVYSNSGAGTWSKVTYRAGIEYDLTPAAMAYATYSTGYQAGDVAVAMGGSGIGVLPYACDRSSNANCSLPLLLKQATLGIKSQWLDRKLQANLEAFDTRYTNQLQVVTAYALDAAPYGVPTTTGCAFNVGDPVGTGGTGATAYHCVTDGASTNQVKSQGVDLDLIYLPTASDRIELSLEKLHSEQSAVSAQVATQAQLEAAGVPAAQAALLLDRFRTTAQGFGGLPQQNSPSTSINASYAHTFQMGARGSLTPKANWIHKSDYWTAGFPTGVRAVTNIQDDYNLYNAYLSWQSADGKFSVNGYVKNIESTPVLLNQGSRPGTAVAVSLDAPRTYGLVVSGNF